MVDEAIYIFYLVNAHVFTIEIAKRIQKISCTSPILAKLDPGIGTLGISLDITD